MLNGDRFIMPYREIPTMEADFWNFRDLFYTHNCFPFYRIGVGGDAVRKMNLRNQVLGPVLQQSQDVNFVSTRDHGPVLDARS